MEDKQNEITEDEIRAQVIQELQGQPEQALPQEDAEEPIEPEGHPPTEPAPELPPAAQERIDALNSEKANLTQRIKMSEGRISKLQSELAEALKITRKLKDMPTREEILEAAEIQKKWQQFREENPDLHDGIDSKIRATEQGLKRELDAIKQRLEQPAQVKDLSSDIQALQTYYPNYRDIVRSEKFRDWIQAAPPHMRVRAQSDALADGLFVLDSFHDYYQSQVSQQKTESAKKRRLAQAVDPGRRGSPPKTAKSLEDMSEDELREHYAREFARTQ